MEKSLNKSPSGKEFEERRNQTAQPANPGSGEACTCRIVVSSSHSMVIGQAQDHVQFVSAAATAHEFCVGLCKCHQRRFGVQ